jgi:hypothetical protein
MAPRNQRQATTRRRQVAALASLRSLEIRNTIASWIENASKQLGLNHRASEFTLEVKEGSVAIDGPEPVRSQLCAAPSFDSPDTVTSYRRFGETNRVTAALVAWHARRRAERNTFSDEAGLVDDRSAGHAGSAVAAIASAFQAAI